RGRRLVKPENIRFFKSATEFRRWLENNHDKSPFQWIGFWKKGSGRSGMSYDEAVLESLCFGWIDGQTNRVDDLAVTTRFSPRRTGSNWSQLNIGRVEELTRAGRMHPAGLAAFDARKAPEPGVYTYETRPADLPPDLAAIFRKSKPAWQFWRAQTPGYRKSMTWWVVSAKQDQTRLRRLVALIDESTKGIKISDTNLPKVKPPSKKA
ncbi:MAG TPA: YdeI/OmpD-associated family protein, partial [Candidatus Limnocylindria bacterium]|nr:YdeI/OmpD-associated family protein [Candidatus Limnocylindria bacterium]